MGNDSKIIAVLGPTNTGKTHYAMERMLAHASGVIGFPLRLLARENYERAIRIKGANKVALITGEEKIVPTAARYFLCTVESMPTDKRVSFLGVDEIQMCADPERGHVFTDRLLNARGTQETMFMGSHSMKPLIRKLVDGVEFVSRPRFSTLTYSGRCKLARLKPRSAVVAFSAADVYAIAEQVRKHKGGAAVVMGALSPRTRSAQVAMFQNGEVDHLVATDAIGMGLNMDVDHIAFASLCKFDGRQPRRLRAPELAQIAGRAGRHMSDGTFGVIAGSEAIDPEIVARMESHQFAPLRRLKWRNTDLHFSSLQALIRSLAKAPEVEGLIKGPAAADEAALAALTADPHIAAIAHGHEAVELLWEVCRIPDFSKVLNDAHCRLLGRIYDHLMAEDQRLPTDWMARQVTSIDRVDGDIETLMQRISSIRTWTYVSHRMHWLEDPGHWQERTRAIEDRLSDALHKSLTQRFVDRRAAVLVKRMTDHADLAVNVNEAGEVWIEDHFVGHMSGFHFAPEAAADLTRTMTNAVTRALKGEVEARAKRLADSADDAFSLTGKDILWHGQKVGRAAIGADPLSPIAETLTGDLLEAAQRHRIQGRMTLWIQMLTAERLVPLFNIRQAPLSGAARGLAFQLAENLGSLPRRGAESQLDALGPKDRKALRALGVRIGRQSVYMPELIKPKAVEIRSLLWAIGADEEPPETPTGRVSLPAGESFHEAIGYRPLGPLAVRLDILERMAARLWTLSRKGPFQAEEALLSLAGCGHQEMDGILKALGYKARKKGETVTYAPHRKRKAPGKKPLKTTVKPDSPFAKLAELQTS